VIEEERDRGKYIFPMFISRTALLRLRR